MGPGGTIEKHRSKSRRTRAVPGWRVDQLGRGWRWERLLQLLRQEMTETSKGLERKQGWIFKMVASSRLGD